MEEAVMTEVRQTAGASVESDIVLLRDVHKSFGNIEVLKGVSFQVKRGEVTVLIQMFGGNEV